MNRKSQDGGRSPASEKPSVPHPTNRRVAPAPARAPAASEGAEHANPRSSASSPATALSGRFERAWKVTRAALAIAVVVAVSGSAAYGARHYVTHSPRFAVRILDLTGDSHRTREAYLAEAGLERGVNVFSVDLDGVRRALAKDPWVRDVAIQRRLPGTISVELKEREAAAIVVLDGSYLATREGDIFKHLEPGDPADYPVITGLSEASVNADRAEAARAIQRALDLAADYEQGPLATRAPLQEVHLTGPDAVTLIVGKNALALAMGEPPYRKKLDEAARVLTELDKRGAKPDTIMLDNATRPERVVVRVR